MERGPGRLEGKTQSWQCVGIVRAPTVPAVGKDRGAQGVAEKFRVGAWWMGPLQARQTNMNIA